MGGYERKQVTGCEGTALLGFVSHSPCVSHTSASTMNRRPRLSLCMVRVKKAAVPALTPSNFFAS